MKIKPIILCGGAGTRLWPESKNNLPKQFIDFGGWTLFKKTLERIKNPIFDSPVISTNSRYLRIIKKFCPHMIFNDILDTPINYIRKLKKEKIFVVNFGQDL